VSLKLKSIPYVIVLCEDLERSIKFYEDYFNLSLLSKKDDWAEFDTGHPIFALHKRGRWGDDISSPEVPGTLVAFEVETGQVDALHQNLKRKGIVMIGEPVNQPWGVRAAYFKDPDGNLVEIFCKNV
jgi:catechol 2,3-dioxygenase-like lactoylglutathione lyase family enzyme